MAALSFDMCVNDEFLLLSVCGHAKRSAELKGIVTNLGTNKTD